MRAALTISGPNETGMCRLALSDSDKQVRDWFVSELKKLRCSVTIDAMGNIFGVRPGKRDGPPTAMGSHLDTQPTGGRYDGILGVQAALEVLRTLDDNKVETEFPVAAITWTNEEGARFPKSMHGSAVWAGAVIQDDGYALADVTDSSVTTKSELERIGYLGSVPCSHKETPLAAHFELHIEQGPILEREDKVVGVVQGGQAYRWYELTVSGRDSHAGTTPLDARADPVLCAARIISAANDIAHKHSGLATTGIFRLEPGSVNTSAREVVFSMDIRHMQDRKLDEMEAELRAAVDELAKGEKPYPAKPCRVEWKPLFANPAIKFDPACIGAVREAAINAVGEEKTRDIYSGAGHDSCLTALHYPTAMVFVPCKDGLSHNPEEYATPEHCTVGAQVLFDAVLAYDSKRTQ